MIGKSEMGLKFTCLMKVSSKTFATAMMIRMVMVLMKMVARVVRIVPMKVKTCWVLLSSDRFDKESETEEKES